MLGSPEWRNCLGAELSASTLPNSIDEIDAVGKGGLAIASSESSSSESRITFCPAMVANHSDSAHHRRDAGFDAE